MVRGRIPSRPQKGAKKIGWTPHSLGMCSTYAKGEESPDHNVQTDLSCLRKFASARLDSYDVLRFVTINVMLCLKLRS